jgi:hypothetical protein
MSTEEATCRKLLNAEVVLCGWNSQAPRTDAADSFYLRTRCWIVEPRTIGSSSTTLGLQMAMPSKIGYAIPSQAFRAVDVAADRGLAFHLPHRGTLQPIPIGYYGQPSNVFKRSAQTASPSPPTYMYMYHASL